MWCSHCQQDVPAVARSVEGPLICPRCDEEFDAEFNTVTDFTQAYSNPTDTGVELDSIDSKPDLAPPINLLEREETHRHLRRIGRRLRSAYRHDPDFGTVPPVSWGPDAAVQSTGVGRLRGTTRRTTSDPVKPTFTSRMVGLLLAAGVAGLVGGSGLLVWAAAFQLSGPWQWGMTTTIAAEGALILGLTWMAGRLWRNSRRLNRQLEGVEGQLDHIERLTGSLANSRMSCSQHYYDHFSQGASSQMLLANLRGQVDQLAERMAG
jgi:hypothetical protein